MDKLARAILISTLLVLLSLTPVLTLDSHTITDDLGRKVTISGTPERVVCICPSSTEIVYSLGLGGKVVGVDRYSDYPPEVVEKQLIGNCWKPDPEEVATLKPDLVIMYSFVGKGDPTVKQLEDAGLTVLALRPNTLEDTIKDIKLVGEATGKVKEAEALTSSLQQRIDAVNQTVSGVEYRPKVYIESYYPPPWTFGSSSWADQMVKIAGGENVFGDAKAPWMKTTDEEVIARKPDVIISLVGMSHYAELKEFEKRVGWENIPAVKHDDVYLMDADLLERPSPRMVDGLETLAKLLHPELFGNESISTYFISSKKLKTSTKTVEFMGPVEASLTMLKVPADETLMLSGSVKGLEVKDGKALAYLRVNFSCPKGVIYEVKIGYEKEQIKALGIDESALALYKWTREGWVPMHSYVDVKGKSVEALSEGQGYFALVGFPLQPAFCVQPWLFALLLGVAVVASVMGTYAKCRK